MVRFLALAGFLLGCNLSSLAQGVSLVFSGGSAKGLAHIGVLKALEENGIPIDHIVGTSMGGIVGGFYAAGFSPDEIERIALSESFQRWVNGRPEPGYNYHYHKSEIQPDFLTVDLSLDSSLNFQLNTTIANDATLNLALLEHLYGVEEISHGDFDKLFVPLRVVASEIFTQTEVVLGSGVLSDALRATLSAPIFYMPVKINQQYLFDGGVYNNFPVEVANKTFHPEAIIGVNVSGKVFNEYPYGRDDKLISNSLLYILLAKSDPTLLPDSSLYINPNLEGYSAFDFNKVRALIDSGYAATIRKISAIRAVVIDTVTQVEVDQRRAKFRARMTKERFGPVDVFGFSPSQDRYLRTVINRSKKQDILSIKKGFFNLVSEPFFENIFPSSRYDSALQEHRFSLTRRPTRNLRVDFGGLVASRDISNLFIGINLYRFRSKLMHFTLNFQTGNFYKSFTAGTRIDFPQGFYLEPKITYDNWNYLATNDVLDEISVSEIPTILKRINRSTGMAIGVPAGKGFKGEFYVGYFNNLDQYVNGSIFITNDQLDRLSLAGFKSSLVFTANTLNHKQYASSGRAMMLRADHFTAEENFNPGTTSVLANSLNKDHQWIRLKLRYEAYYGKGFYRPGLLGELQLSSRVVLTNYYGTLINTGAFYPFQDSRIFILQKYRAYNFIAGGMRNVFRVGTKMDFRLEGYALVPLEQLNEGNAQRMAIRPGLGRVSVAAGSSLVYHSPIGPIALAANYYQDSENPLSILFHIGYMLYRSHSLE